MKRWIATALVSLAALGPSTAMAAQEAEGHGSWLGFVFFAINFLLFVFILVYFAGPPLRRFFSDRKRASWRIAVLPNRVIEPSAGQAAAPQANAARSIRTRTDHSGSSPHKAHTPGVKNFLH